jgi:hypothetical protein
MRAKEIQSKAKKQATNYKLWSAPVRIEHPNYVGRVEVTVTAPNIYVARQLLKSQYGIPDWSIGSIKEVK